MKKYLSLMFLLVVLVLAACGGNSSDSNDGGSTDGGDDGAASGETVDIKIAGYQPDDHPSTQLLYKFAEQVEENTDGRIQMKVFPASQLGDYITIYKEIMEGTIEMGLI